MLNSTRNSPPPPSTQAQPKRPNWPKRKYGTYWDRQKFFSLYRRRHGYRDRYIRDDADGRRLVVVLLVCGINIEELQDLAPWLDDAELERLKRRAFELTLDDAGAEFKLTFEEWKLYVGTPKRGRYLRFRPHDDPSGRKMWSYMREQRKQSDRKRKEKERAKLQGMSEADQRELVLCAIINKERRLTLPQLTKRCSTRVSFAHDNPEVVRKRVQRTAKTAAAQGLVAFIPGKRGRASVVQRTAKNRLISGRDLSQNLGQPLVPSFSGKTSSRQRFTDKAPCPLIPHKPALVGPQPCQQQESRAIQGDEIADNLISITMSSRSQGWRAKAVGYERTA